MHVKLNTIYRSPLTF